MFYFFSKIEKLILHNSHNLFMPQLPRINKRALLHATQQKLRPPRAEQLFLFGKVQPKKPITKEDILATAFERVQALSMQRAHEITTKNRRKSYNKAQRETGIRLLASVYAWPELFNGRRGFVSEKDAYRRNVHFKDTGKVEPYKGVDIALYHLRKNGMTMTELQRMTKEILFNHAEDFKHIVLEETDGHGRVRNYCGTRAAQLYADKIKPNLIQNQIIPEHLLRNEETMAAIDHNIIFILYLGMRRELSDRKVREIGKQIRERKVLQKKEARRDRLISRQDVQEEVAKGVPLELALDAVPHKPHHIPKKKPKNRFL